MKAKSRQVLSSDLTAPNKTEKRLRGSESPYRVTTSHTTNGGSGKEALATIDSMQPRSFVTVARRASTWFVDVILGKLVEALRPGLYDQLEGPM